MADLDQANEHHMSAEEFCYDVTAVDELKQFLNTETGKKLRRVLNGCHPLAQSARVSHLNTKDMLAMAQLEAVNPHGVLGFQRGWQAVLSLITQTLTIPLHRAPPASRKAKGSIPSHPATLP